MTTSIVQYKGNLRTEAEHLASGEVVISDAPLDNNGKGEAFSPTDFLATSLASCIITVMGIHAEKNSIPFEGVRASVTKIMASAPRRVAKIKIDLSVNKEGLTDQHMRTLENVGRNCPVAKSLSPELVQELTFHFT